VAAGPLDQAFNAILKATEFKRRGPTMRLIRNNVAGLVNFQRSSWSSRQEIRFTVNVGVVYGALLPSRVPLDRALECDAQVRERLGALSHRKHDFWWTINESTDVEALSSEIVSEVTRYAIPFIEKNLDPQALLDSWEAGVAPGLTFRERLDLLERLKTAYRLRTDGPAGDAPSARS
jgi:hypothetical protein